MLEHGPSPEITRNLTMWLQRVYSSCAALLILVFCGQILMGWEFLNPDLPLALSSQSSGSSSGYWYHSSGSGGMRSSSFGGWGFLGGK